MWKAIVEIWYRLKVRKFTLKIEKGTKNRTELKALQTKNTLKREEYQEKLDIAKLK